MWVRGERLPNVRTLNKEKYNISKHRFAEVYHFCMQYNEWQDELKYKIDTVKSVEITDMPLTHSNGDSTSRLACRRAELNRKCELVEQTAIEAAPEFYNYLLKAVTNEGITFNYLKSVMVIPCGRDMYYDRRRKFYWLMSKKLVL